MISIAVKGYSKKQRAAIVPGTGAYFALGASLRLAGWREAGGRRQAVDGSRLEAGGGRRKAGGRWQTVGVSLPEPPCPFSCGASGDSGERLENKANGDENVWR